MRTRKEILEELATKAHFQVSDIEMMDASQENIQQFIKTAKVEAGEANGATVAVVSYKDTTVTFAWNGGTCFANLNEDAMRSKVELKELAG